MIQVYAPTRPTTTHSKEELLRHFLRAAVDDERRSKKSIGIINKVRNLLNKETLINLYYVFIYPYITYCNVIWGRAPNTYLSKVHILQKRVLYLLLNALSRRRREVNHVSFACAIPHVIIKFVA